MTTQVIEAVRARAEYAVEHRIKNPEKKIVIETEEGSLFVDVIEASQISKDLINLLGDHRKRYQEVKKLIKHKKNIRRAYRELQDAYLSLRGEKTMALDWYVKALYKQIEKTNYWRDHFHQLQRRSIWDRMRKFVQDATNCFQINTRHRILRKAIDDSYNFFCSHYGTEEIPCEACRKVDEIIDNALSEDQQFEKENYVKNN